MILPPDDVSELWPGIALMMMDRATSSATVITSDRRRMSFPLPSSPFSPTSTIVTFTYDPRANRVSLETNRGDTIVAEIPSLQNPAPRGSRPVVYLDQKDWSLLADVLHEPERIYTTGAQDSAERLIALARETKIILPMSLGHMSETSKWTNTERRYHLALTLAQLSRGWQMRYPLDIRKYELRQSLATRIKQEPLPSLDMFTLEACAAQPASPTRQHFGKQAGLPPDMANAVDALTCISSYFDAILDSEAVPMAPISDWVSANQDFTAWLAGESRNSSQKRRSIAARFWADAKLEVVEAAHDSGVTLAEFEKWLMSHFDQDVRMMRSLGLYREIYQDKHLDPGAVWKSNDLIDMMYLTCAAGYADYVVGDRSLVNHAKQAAQRLQRSINIFPRISDLVVALESTGL